MTEHSYNNLSPGTAHLSPGTASVHLSSGTGAGLALSGPDDGEPDPSKAPHIDPPAGPPVREPERQPPAVDPPAEPRQPPREDPPPSTPPIEDPPADPPEPGEPENPPMIARAAGWRAALTAPPPGQPIGGARAVLRTVALMTWVVLAGACQGDAADPVKTAQTFAAAAQRGDMKAVLPLLEKSAAERLSQAAEKASDQVGGRREIQPAEMLQIVDISPIFEVAEAVLVDNDGGTAHVKLVGAQQETYTLTLVLEDGAWHVRIPTPLP